MANATWDAQGFLDSLARARAVARVFPRARLAERGAKLLQAIQSQPGFPYDTGSLEGSGKLTPQPDVGQAVVVELSFGGESPQGVNNPVTYAEPVHEGTPHMAARPYLGAPLVAYGQSAIEDAAEDAWNDIAAAWRG